MRKIKTLTRAVPETSKSDISSPFHPLLVMIHKSIIHPFPVYVELRWYFVWYSLQVLKTGRPVLWYFSNRHSKLVFEILIDIGDQLGFIFLLIIELKPSPGFFKAAAWFPADKNGQILFGNYTFTTRNDSHMGNFVINRG